MNWKPHHEKQIHKRRRKEMEIGECPVIDYTWDDWVNMRRFLGIDWAPRDHLRCKTPKDMIRYYFECKYSAYGEDPLNKLYHFLFEVPLEEVPLYVNEEVPLLRNANTHTHAQGALLISKAAEWRLQLGK